MDVRLKFLGGAGSVTGSKYLLEVDDFKCLIDCGLFQGLKALRLRNWAEFPLPANEIHCILLTHAHLDHSGYVPRLVKQGFSGPIYCTSATAALLEILWLDAAKLQEEEAEFAKKKGYSKHENPEALFGEKEARMALDMLKPILFNTDLKINSQLKLIFHPAGHILGASSIEIKLVGDQQEKTMIFSGDIGRQEDPVLYPPTHFSSADIVLIESTYGNRENITHDTSVQLAHYINQCSDEGVVLLPAFTVGRTQNLLYLIRQLMESGTIRKMPVYIDSPMAIAVTDLYSKFEEEHKLKGMDVFHYPQFHYVQKPEQSNALLSIKSKAIIISASGMLTGGRILTHLFHRLLNKNDLLLFVGYQAVGTRGRRILEKEEEVKIYGEMRKVKCQVEKIDGLSAHADQSELISWYKAFQSSPKYTFIVHGEPDAAKELQKKLQEDGSKQNVIVPEYLESFQLFDNI